jgi:hypothetical protein
MLYADGSVDPYTRAEVIASLQGLNNPTAAEQARQLGYDPTNQSQQQDLLETIKQLRE